MGKKAEGKMEVNEYLMSLHYGICSGPVDALLEIIVDEKSAWTGSLTSETEFPIYSPNLFGGPKKEGGLSGGVRYLPGGPSQVMPEHLAARVGLTTATCPGYRGVSSIFFFGVGNQTYQQGGLFSADVFGHKGNGFIWKNNVPYLPGAWAKVLRRSRGLSEGIALIGADSNPAHMIYECVTNTDWGMGASAAMVDVQSLETAGQTLYNEGFGLSMIWTRQTSIENFINEIIDHIQAVFFVNPRNGLMTLKLIRDDYDVDDLPHFTPDNCTVTKFQRKMWGETTNEIVVTWTNPVNEQEETIIQQDLANITQQGAVVSDSRNYYGVRNANLASELAVRDLRAAASPLASFELDIDRTGWDLLPGGLFRLTYPEHGVFDLVLRIGPVNYGKPGAPTIKITATEDVFTQQTQAYVLPPSSGWVDPSENPAPMAFVRPFTLPAYLSVQMAGRSLETAVYPEALIGFLAAQTGHDTFAYDLLDVALNSVVGTRNLVGRALLQAPMVAEASSTIVSFPGAIGMVSPAISRLVFIGNADDEGMEIARIASSDGGGGWVLDRGLLDTVPRAWTAGTPVWFVDVASNIYDSRIQSAADTVDYKLLPRTSKGVLAAADALVVSVTLDDRPYRPSRPANVKIGSTAFGTMTGAGFGPWNVTWSERNRRTEDSAILGWSAGTVAPEAGQTTTITVLTMAGAVINTIDGITGTSYSLPKAAFGGNTSGRVRVTSKRDGFESLQGHEIVVTGIT